MDFEEFEEFEFEICKLSLVAIFPNKKRFYQAQYEYLKNTIIYQQRI